MVRQLAAVIGQTNSKSDLKNVPIFSLAHARLHQTVGEAEALQTTEDAKLALHLDVQKLLGRVEQRKARLEREQRSLDMNIEVGCLLIRNGSEGWWSSKSTVDSYLTNCYSPKSLAIVARRTT